MPTKEMSAKQLSEIIESIPKEVIFERMRQNSAFTYRQITDLHEQKIRDQFMVFRPKPKTELLSPDGEVLMRDGELVDKENPKIYVGMDFGFNEI